MNVFFDCNEKTALQHNIHNTVYAISKLSSESVRRERMCEQILTLVSRRNAERKTVAAEARTDNVHISENTVRGKITPCYFERATDFLLSA